MSILNDIPNPFDKSSTHAGFEKKGRLLKERASFGSLIKRLVFFCVVGLILTFAFKFPPTIPLLLIGAEVLTTFISIFIKVMKIRDLKSTDIENKAQSYRNVLIKVTYWNFITSIIGVIISGVAATLLFTFFSSEVSQLISKAVSLEITIDTVYLKAAFLIFFIAWTLYFVVQFIRYKLIKNLNQKTDDYAEMNRDYRLIDEKIKLVIAALVMTCITLIFFKVEDIPNEIALIALGVTLLTVVLSVVSIIRLKRVQFQNEVTNQSDNTDKIQILKDEKIEGIVYGIKRVGKGSGGFSFLGTGKEKSPENSLLITNKRLLPIQVPVAGGDKIVGDNSYVSKNFLFNRGEIRERGQQLIEENSLGEILKFVTEEASYENIETVTLQKTKLVIKIKTGKKLSYFFMDREYIDVIDNLLQEHLKEKFIKK